jgi:hypothetical protein
LAKFNRITKFNQCEFKCCLTEPGQKNNKKENKKKKKKKQNKTKKQKETKKRKTHNKKKGTMFFL